MPVKRCTRGGKSGWKWGDTGKCYTGKGAKEKAKRQGRAIHVNKSAKALLRLRRLQKRINSAS
jgi:hypothetical protein